MTNSKSKSKKPSSSANRLSMSAENYLLSIYRLDEQDTRVTLTVLSEHLKTLPVDEGMGTSLPSVGGMIRRMVREGLLDLAHSGRKDCRRPEQPKDLSIWAPDPWQRIQGRQSSQGTRSSFSGRPVDN